mgnify:CR=1 FL=1
MRVLLSLGSNVGDREAYLCQALDALARTAGITVVSVSSGYETKPMGLTEQPDFLNLAAEIETEFAPLELLNAVKEIEEGLGRATSERWGPRVIDIDVILYGGLAMTTDRLTLPHPEFRNRNFVLGPLAEIAPEAVDPVTGKTVAELAEGPQAQGRIERIGPVVTP